MGSDQDGPETHQNLLVYRALDQTGALTGALPQPGDLYAYGVPVVKRNGLHSITSMETASTEAFISHTVVRSSTSRPTDTERLMTVSLPYDERCETDYERSSSDASPVKAEAQPNQGQEDEEDERTILQRLKAININMDLAAYMLIFIITNSAQPLLICLLRQKGGTPNGTYTFLIPTYLAMICVGYYPTKKSIWEESWYYPLVLSGMDIVHQVIEKAGLVYCGPSIYTVASSTNTMFLALFSSAILKRRISPVTWLAISLISGSIALGGVTQMDDITSTHVLGFALVVAAAMVNALNSIISEDLLRKKHIEGPNLVAMMGIISLSIFCLWSLVFTIPQRHVLFDPKSKINPFDLTAAVTVLVLLFVSNFFRSSVYYYIMKEAGSICCGVLKAVRIIIVVLGSHALFSYGDKTQVMTTSKLISSAICSMGVLLYSLEHSGLQKHKEA